MNGCQDCDSITSGRCWRHSVETVILGPAAIQDYGSHAMDLREMRAQTVRANAAEAEVTRLQTRLTEVTLERDIAREEVLQYFFAMQDIREKIEESGTTEIYRKARAKVESYKK